MRFQTKPIAAALGSILASSLLAACSIDKVGSPRNPPSLSDLRSLTMKVGVCRGFCPAYDVTFDRSRLTFVGERNTRVKEVTFRAAPGLLARLEQTLASARPSGAGLDIGHEQCSAYVTDQRVVTVTWVYATGREQKLTFDLGCVDPSYAGVRKSLGTARGLMPIDDLVGQADRF